MTSLDPIYIRSIVESALAEDIGSGDITTLLTVPYDVNEDHEVRATIIAKQEGVVAGLPLVEEVFSSGIIESCEIDVQTIVNSSVGDGYFVEEGQAIAWITGQPHTILTGERVALNFLQRMSGIATLTRKYVDLVSHTKARIVDTRKTTPGLRRLEKYAVTVGGGYNHRFGLGDGILIKDNHIAAAGGIIPAITAAKKRAPHTLKIEIEVTSLEQLQTALKAGADIIMLDNMSIDQMQEAVSIANGRVLLEASGGVNEKTVVAIAETGVDIISVGALTHSAPALDISLNIAQV